MYVKLLKNLFLNYFENLSNFRQFLITENQIILTYNSNRLVRNVSNLDDLRETL